MSSVIVLQFITFLFCFLRFEKVKYVVLLGSIITAVASTYLLLHQLSSPTTSYISLFHMFSKYDLGILSDSLSVVVVWCVAISSALITCFSLGYFAKQLHSFLMMTQLLSLFLMIFICANNLLHMYIIIELLTILVYFIIRANIKGLSENGASYLRPNYFSNFLLLIAMFLIEQFFGTLSFDSINETIIDNDQMLRYSEWITFLLVANLLIKTSQIFSSCWIKTTMASPIPIACLIHMGIAMHVFLIIRLQNLFEYNEFVLNILSVFGLISSVYCAVKATYSQKLQNILAYSATSQIGLMLAACGFSAYSATVMLFVTYCFSKLLVCLSVTSVTYSLSGENRLENMGGLFELLPKSYISMIIATLSLINLPLLSSYYAKKQFISEIIAGNSPIYYLAIFMILIGSILTSLYLFRMIYLIFHGKNRVSEIDLAYLSENNHYINMSMYVCAFFTIFSGVIFYYFAMTDIIWKDVFAFLYENSRKVIVAFSVVNIAGIIGALFVCKSISPKSFDFSFKMNFLKTSDFAFFQMPSLPSIVNLPFSIGRASCFMLLLLLLVFKVVSGA